MKHQALNADEYSLAKNWLANHHDAIPDEVGKTFEKLLATYHSLAKASGSQRAILLELRQAMGFLSKSEKGSLDEKK